MQKNKIRREETIISEYNESSELKQLIINDLYAESMLKKQVVITRHEAIF